MLENIPIKETFTLGGLINCRRYQVCSRSLCNSEGASFTLLAFDGGEGVSAEQYPGDTLYTALSGSCTLTGDVSVTLKEGESAVITEGTLHSVSCSEQFRLMQLTINRGEDKMSRLIDHIPHKEAISLKDQIAYEPGQVVSMTLTNQEQIGMTLFAFDKDTKIGTHAAPGDAMPTVLEGEAEITISGTTYNVHAGESIVMPAGEPHSLRAITPFKMLLVLVKK